MRVANVPNSRFFEKSNVLKKKFTRVRELYGEMNNPHDQSSGTAYVDYSKHDSEIEYDPFVGVEMFADMYPILADLSSSEMQVLSYVFSNMKRNCYDVYANCQDFLKFWGKNGDELNEKTFYRGLKGLRDRKLLFFCEKNVYWVNYMYFFKGNRVKKKSTYSCPPDFGQEILSNSVTFENERNTI